MSARDPGTAPTYLGLLRGNGAFRLLWLGQLVSFFGDWFKMIALYTIVQQITDSALALSGVVVASTLPVFLVIPIAGPIVDRFDRRAVMVLTDVARAVLALGLIAAHWLASLPLLFAVLVVMVGFSGVFIPARTAVIPQITTDEELPVAMALSGGTWSVMLAFGAATGGVVTQVIGVDGSLVLDALTFLLSAAFLWGLPKLPPTEEEEAPPGRSTAGLVAGLRYLRGKPYLATVLSNKPAMGMAGAALAMLPLFGNGVFKPVGGPFWIGVLYAMRGVGALIGSMGIRRIVGDADETMRRLIAPGYLVMAVGLGVVASAPAFDVLLDRIALGGDPILVSTGILVAAAGYFVVATGQGTIWVFSSVLAQRASDRAYRGRVFSLEFGVMTLVMSTSSLAGGGAVDAGVLAEPAVVGVVGALMFLPAIAWAAALPWMKRQGLVERAEQRASDQPAGVDGAPGPA